MNDISKVGGRTDGRGSRRPHVERTPQPPDDGALPCRHLKIMLTMLTRRSNRFCEQAAGIIGLGRMREKVTPARRIAYENERDFCEVKIQKKRVLVRVFNTGLPDPKGIVTDIPKSHGWQYEKEIPIASLN